MLDLFAEHPDCVVAAGECDFVGPAGEILYTTDHAAQDVHGALLHACVQDIVSLPAGAAAVMRTDAYRKAGGYRPEFYFAQDLDLWIRMAPLGEIRVDPVVLYEVRIEVGTISSVYRPEQLASASLSIALRDAPESERVALLRQAALIQPTGRTADSTAQANAEYFIASCLLRRRDGRWRGYAARALRRDPLHLRSWLLLLRGAIG
jgi:hypothetical protein